MIEEIRLPQMTNYIFLPWFPLPTRNKNLWGKHRNDLPDDAYVHNYYGFWTKEELYSYGALPPKNP